MGRSGARVLRYSLYGCIVLMMLASIASTESFCSIIALLRGTAFSDNTSPQLYTFTPTAPRWCAVAVRPQGGDWDLQLYTASAPSPTCATNLGANSNRIAGVDIVVADFNHMLLQPEYPKAIRGQGAAGYQIEWDEGQLLAVNSEWRIRNVGPTDIIDVWDIGLESNVPYHFDFENNADCRLLLFRNPASAPFWAARSAALMDVVTSTNVTVGTADRYGVVVVNETGAVGSYALRVTACVSGDVHDLSSGIGNEAIPSLSYYSFTPAVPAWSAVSIRDLFSDWDLYVGQALGPANYPGCNDPLASSAGTNRTEFVIGDFNTGGNPLQEYFVTCDQKAYGPSSGTVKFRGDGAQIVVGEPAFKGLTTDGLQLWNVQLTAGRRYTIDFSRNFTDAQFYLFHNPGGPFWGTRSDAVLTGNLATVYTAPSTGVYGIVVVNENSEDGSYSVGVCDGNLPSLTSGIIAPVSQSSTFRFRQLHSYWAAVGVRSLAGNWDIDLTRGACHSGAGIAGSELTGSQVDFVIADFNHTPLGDLSVQASRVTGTSSAVVEWDDGGDQIVPNMLPVTRATGPNDVLEVWDVYLTAGRPYDIYFARQGAADTKLFLFQSSDAALYADRSRALIATQATSTTFTPPTSDFYGLVVVNDNGGMGSYALGVATTVTDVETSATPRTSALRGVAPNPSAGPVRIDYDLENGGEATIDIIDVAGRIVTSKSTSASTSGPQQIEWNGLDERGRRMPAGIYWARLSVARHAIGTRKFLLVR